MAKKIKLGTNPLYDKKAQRLQVIADFNEGNHEVLKNPVYLWPHEFEQSKGGEKIRKIRELRSRYTNCVEIVISTWVSLVLKNDPTIPQEVIDLFTEEGISDVDAEGRDIKTFMREVVAPIYFAYGNPHILTNAPATPAISQSEQVAMGIKPFWKALSPLEIKDWLLDSSVPSVKKYKAIRWEYFAEKERESILEKAVLQRQCQAFQIKNGAVVDMRFVADGSGENPDWEITSETPLNGFKEIPIAFVNSDSWLYGVDEQQLRLFNLESSLDCQLNSQAFQRIFISGMTSEKAKVTISEYIINFLPEGANVVIAEPTNPVALMARIEQVSSLLFKVAFNRQFVLSPTSKEAPGADTTKAMREEQLALVLNAIDDLEMLLNKAIQHYALFKNKKNFKGKVTLSRDVDELDIERAIQLAQSVYDDMKQYPTWFKEFLKSVAKKMQLGDEEEILKEIDAGSAAGPKSLKSIIENRLNGNNQEVSGTATV